MEDFQAFFASNCIRKANIVKYKMDYRGLEPQILVHSHFELVSLPLALDATELVSQPVTDKHSSHFSTAKEMSVKVTFFLMYKPQQTNFEMMLKCC